MGNFIEFLKRTIHGTNNRQEELISKSASIRKSLPCENIKYEPSHKKIEEYVVYFTNGHLSKIDPYPCGGYYENRDIANNALSIVSDGIVYDLTDVVSIHSIAIPNYKLGVENGIGTTGFLEYVLRMRSGNYWNSCEYELSIACLEKATQLMKYSTMGWPVKDFFRIVNELNDLGEFKKAKKWQRWLEVNIPGAADAIALPPDEAISAQFKLSFQERVKSCKEMGTDLIEVGDLGACCPVCAKYRKRVYSLSGGNKRFPKFPDDFHFGCGLSLFPYIENLSEPSFLCNNVVSYSNRPFIDDRSTEEIDNYSNRMGAILKQSEIIRSPSLTRIIYYQLKQLLPNDAPKSLSGFSRMRNSNSKNYQALVRKAEDAGFVFPKSLEEVASWGK